jgi:hypothetical protein
MLSQWFVARLDFSSHSEFVLGGYVYGHLRLRDGHPALTSTILEIAEDQSWARTLNTLYWLHGPAASGGTDSDWQVRLLLFAAKRIVAPVTLRGIETRVDWPYSRSPAAKFVKPKAN